MNELLSKIIYIFHYFARRHPEAHRLQETNQIICYLFGGIPTAILINPQYYKQPRFPTPNLYLISTIIILVTWIGIYKDSLNYFFHFKSFLSIILHLNIILINHEPPLLTFSVAYFYSYFFLISIYFLNPCPFHYYNNMLI